MTRVVVASALGFCLFVCAACDKHEFAPGERVRRKYNPNIGGVILRRENYDGKGDVYWIKYTNQDGELAADRPNLPEELERIP